MDMVLAYDCVPQTSLVKKLFLQIPKPKESQTKKTLPFWEISPLYYKLPDLNIKGVDYTRGKIGTSILITYPDAEFITYDPYCYEHDGRKYDSFHDRHLKNFFKSKAIRQFLKKIGILDKDNYPKCSVADINSYRFYLSRMHKESVKKAFVEHLNNLEEKRQWKFAQDQAVKNFFAKSNKENVHENRRIQLLIEKKHKEIKLLKSIKKWDEIIARREEGEKENEMIKTEMIRRKREKYDNVIKRGVELSRQRPIKTLVKMREQRLLREEMDKKRNKAKEFKKRYNDRKHLYHKAVIQAQRIELCERIASLKEKCNTIAIQNRQLKIEKERELFAKKFHCRKAGAFNEIRLRPSEELFEKHVEIVERPERYGITYIRQFLVPADKRFDKNYIISKLSQIQNSDAIKTALIKVATMLIRRGIYECTYLFIQHFTEKFLEYLVKVKMSPEIKEQDFVSAIMNKLKEDIEYCPSEHSERNKQIMEATRPVDVLFDGDENKKNGEDKPSAQFLRSFLGKRENLIKSMLTNAQILFTLIFKRYKLLSKDNLYKKKKKLRKRANQMRNSNLNTVLMDLLISDPNNIILPQSDLSDTANVLAILKITHYSILQNMLVNLMERGPDFDETELEEEYAMYDE